jgi:hypothetical protein
MEDDRMRPMAGGSLARTAMRALNARQQNGWPPPMGAAMTTVSACSGYDPLTLG